MADLVLRLVREPHGDGTFSYTVSSGLGPLPPANGEIAAELVLAEGYRLRIDGRGSSVEVL